jgi:hypothetical protein
MRARATDSNYSGYTKKFDWPYEKFKEDMYESYLEHVKEYGKRNTTLDRIDGTKGYYKENCRWATRKTQNNNMKSNIYLTDENGISKTPGEWQLFYNSNIPVGIIGKRVKLYGWSIKDACTTPVRAKKKYK